MLSKEELIKFEEDMAQEFLDGKIKAPVHLSKGNEQPLINIFYKVKPDDWVFSTHRSHYHALLKGIPKEKLAQEILEGRSIHTFDAEHNFFTSSIVGGCTSIATGVALGLKLLGSKEKVYCFVGDMAAETGVFSECTRYAERQALPINFIVEDNGFSTDAPTKKVWGEHIGESKVHRYSYERGYPHVGVGQWVTF